MCSNHRLNIELGRHNNIVEERIFTFCYEQSSNEVINDEFHVIFLCKQFDHYKSI